MPKQGLTEIICVIDQSGSMLSLKSDAIGGFNSFLEEQQKLDGEAIMTVTLFDTQLYTHCNGTPIQNVIKFNNAIYKPRGNTALYDAVAGTIDEVGNRLSLTVEDKRPEKVIFVIITDGEENSSRKYTYEQLKEKIKHQTDVYKWEFIYLGANQDAMANAAKIYIPAANAYNFESNSKGLAMCYSTASHRATSSRTKS